MQNLFERVRRPRYALLQEGRHGSPNLLQMASGEHPHLSRQGRSNRPIPKGIFILTESNRVRDLGRMLYLRFGVKLLKVRNPKDKLHRYRLKDIRTNKYICGAGKPVSYIQILDWVRKHGLHPYIKSIPDDYEPGKREVYMMPLCAANYWQPEFTQWIFDPRYEVTITGHIFDTFDCKFMARFTTKTRRHYFCRIPVGGKKTANVEPHRYVALFFCPNAKHKRIVHHIDCEKLNDNANNLLWVTSGEHSELHSIFNKGNIDFYYKRIAEILRDNKGE